MFQNFQQVKLILAATWLCQGGQILFAAYRNKKNLRITQIPSGERLIWLAHLASQREDFDCKFSMF